MNNMTTKCKKYLMLGVLSISNMNFAMQNESNQPNKWKKLIQNVKSSVKVVQKIYENAPRIKEEYKGIKEEYKDIKRVSKQNMEEGKNLYEVWKDTNIERSNRLPAIIEGVKNISRISKKEEPENKYKTEKFLKGQNRCKELGLSQKQYQEILNKIDEQDIDLVLKMDNKQECEAILEMNKEDREAILQVLRENNQSFLFETKNDRIFDITTSL